MGLTSDQRKRFREAVSEDAKRKTGSIRKPREPSVVNGEIVRHGTYASYKAGCHCDKCTYAHKRYNAAHRKVPCVNAPECKNMVWRRASRSGECRDCSNATKKDKLRN